jgi:hypothetical protein
MWNQGRNIHVAHGGDGLKQDTVNLLTVAPNVGEIENMWCFSSRDEAIHPSVLLLLQVQSEQADCYHDSKALDFICLCLQIQEEKSWASSGIKVARIPDVIPVDYGCIATCIASNKHFPMDESGAVGVVYLVGTKYKQVVLCVEGNVTNIVPLQDVPTHLAAIKVQRAEYKKA